MDDTLYDGVAATAQAVPGAVALHVQDTTVTYAELLDLVDRVATRMIRTVGRPPSAVGLLCSRSLAASAGYLAALRLGATVVPLNPAFPAARNTAMCLAAGVDVLLVDDNGARSAPPAVTGTAGIGTAVVEMTGDTWRRWPAGDLPAVDTGADDVAYTLFTSGSTGQPKGVPIRHRNVKAYVEHCAARYGVAPGDRLSQAFDLTFDPSVFDMFVAWLAGATLVVPQPDEVLTPARFVNERGITHWFSVPSIISIARRFRQLRPGSMPSLRWSLFAGEQLTLDQAAAWADAAPGSIVENLYGPTELTVTCTEYRLPADRSAWPVTSNGTVPIGRVLPGLTGVVLDADGREAADGELCVSGPQRFDGYLDPAHDDGRFVRFTPPGPATIGADRSPAAYYRTGDRVREEDGVLVHLGRIDNQVKIHGYRVELAEIEAVVRRHPAVADAVVVAVPGERGEISLHAVHLGTPVPAAELADLVRVNLPAYMVPASFHLVDAFPLNANGKTDRRRVAELVAGSGTRP